MKKNRNAKEAQKSFRSSLEQNYDLGWAEALFKVVEERGWWDKPAIYYRGTSFTYRQLKEYGFLYAQALKANGVEKGDVIPFCTSHCPQEIFSLVGASLNGAIVMPFGEHFEEDYIIDRLENKNAKLVITTNDKYPRIKDKLDKTNVKKTVVLNLKKYSIENCFLDEEEKYLGKLEPMSTFMHMDNVIVESKFLLDGRIYGQNQEFEVVPSHLDDPFSITFSSGTTNSRKPKPIVHNNSTYIGMGLIRAKETPDLNKFSKTGETRALVHIPLFSNTSLLASISDELFLGATLCLEPIYDEKYAIYALLRNKPNLAIMTPSHWITAMKRLKYEDQFAGYDLRYLMAPFTAGEPTSAGEEKFINQVFREFNISKDFPIFRPIISLGMGAGDCENSGLWRMPHRAKMEKLKKMVNFTKKNVEKGYETYSVVDYAILGENGEHLGPNQYGKLVVDSPFTMSGYDDMPEETMKTKDIDDSGRVWTDCKLWSYEDEMGEVFIKGRYSKDEKYPLFMVDDEICKDTKHIMSCKTVAVDGAYVAHIDIQPDKSINIKDLLSSIEARLGGVIPEEIQERLVFKIRPRLYSYPLTGCGKRSSELLTSEGIECTWKVALKSYKMQLVPGDSYIADIDNAKKLTLNKNE